MTPEELQAELLKAQATITNLESEKAQLISDRDVLVSEKTNLTNDLTSVREMNMKLFSQVYSQETQPNQIDLNDPQEDKPKETKSWDDFMGEFEL